MIEFDFVAYAGAVGALMPLVISFLKQSSWSTQTKKYFATALSIIAAVIVTGAEQGWSNLSYDNVLTAIAVIVPVTRTFYVGFWEDTLVEAKLAGVFSE